MQRMFCRIITAAMQIYIPVLNTCCNKTEKYMQVFWDSQKYWLFCFFTLQFWLINKLFLPLSSYPPAPTLPPAELKLLMMTIKQSAELSSSWTRQLLVLESTWGRFANLVVNWISPVELIPPKMCLEFSLALYLSWEGSWMPWIFYCIRKWHFSGNLRFNQGMFLSFCSYPAGLSKSLACLASPFFRTPLFSLLIVSCLWLSVTWMRKNLESSLISILLSLL